MWERVNCIKSNQMCNIISHCINLNRYGELARFTELDFRPIDDQNCDVIFDKPVIFMKLDAGITIPYRTICRNVYSISRGSLSCLRFFISHIKQICRKNCYVNESFNRLIIELS